MVKPNLNEFKEYVIIVHTTAGDNCLEYNTIEEATEMIGRSNGFAVQLYQKVIMNEQKEN